MPSTNHRRSMRWVESENAAPNVTAKTLFVTEIRMKDQEPFTWSVSGRSAATKIETKIEGRASTWDAALAEAQSAFNEQLTGGGPRYVMFSDRWIFMDGDIEVHQSLQEDISSQGESSFSWDIHGSFDKTVDGIGLSHACAAYEDHAGADREAALTSMRAATEILLREMRKR